MPHAVLASLCQRRRELAARGTHGAHHLRLQRLLRAQRDAVNGAPRGLVRLAMAINSTHSLQWTALAVLGLACTSSSVSPTSASSQTPGDAAQMNQDAAPPTQDAEAVDASTTPAQCNTLVQQGKPVVVTADPAEAPTASGGRTRDGSYVLTSMVLYGTPRPFDYALSSTLEAQGLRVNVLEDSSKGETRKTGDGKVEGALLTLTETCAYPKRALLVETAKFTATETTIALHGEVGGRTLVQTYTRQ